MNDKTPKASFITLGCKVNQAESEALAQLLTQEGYQVVKEAEDPDVVIINTCTVTGTGSSKSRKLIRKLAKEHPLSTVVVMGCYSQTKPEEVAELEGVDLIVGTQDRQKIVDYLRGMRKSEAQTDAETSLRIEEEGRIFGEVKLTENGCGQIGERTAAKRRGKPVLAVRAFAEDTVYEELPLIENESRARAMLKIQDGCSQFCTYCIIPYARGPSRSRDPEKVLAEAKKLIETGYKEIVLTGVHIGAYGHELSAQHLDLKGLIQELVCLPGMTRLRLGSIEPMEFTPELVEIVTGNEVICPHFHIPLQSGTNRILEKMRRPYTTENYALLLTKIRQRLPEAAIATDILTGFPGETEEDHQEALKFAASCEFAGMHVFPYSRREGTPAADMPNQVPKSVKAARVRDLIQIGQESRRKYIRQFAGRSLEVLIEKVKPDGTIQGHTSNYLEMNLPPAVNPGNWQAGDLVSCILQEEYVT